MSLPRIGIIGLGIMGGAYARHLRKAGFTVCGHDPAPTGATLMAEIGGTHCAGPAEVAAASDHILMALPSEKALAAVTETLVPALRPGMVLAEMSTFPVAAKEAAAARVAEAGAVLLDCPVSGTGAQAAVGDLVVFISGDEAAGAKLVPVFEAMARDIRHVGPFGAGMKLKFVANLLVSIHNLATAEALLLAERSGLDLKMTIDAIASGAGTSRMFELRAPLMAEGRYEPATMKNDVYIKDVMLILEQARATDTAVPLMAATLPFYSASLAQGRHKQDTAALFEVLKQLSANQGGSA